MDIEQLWPHIVSNAKAVVRYALLKGHLHSQLHGLPAEMRPGSCDRTTMCQACKQEVTEICHTVMPNCFPRGGAPQEVINRLIPDVRSHRDLLVEYIEQGGVI